MEEDKQSRIYGEKQLLDVSLSFSSGETKMLMYPVKVCLRDELVGKTKVGGYYCFVGNKSTHIINNKLMTVLEPLQLHKYVVPKSVLPVWQAFQYSPWQFAFHMADTFASNIVPVGTYFGLKLMLLMCLVKVNEPQNSCTSFLVLTSDTLLPNRLLTFASSFCSPDPAHTMQSLLHPKLQLDIDIIEDYSSNCLKSETERWSTMSVDEARLASTNLNDFFHKSKEKKLLQRAESFPILLRICPWNNDYFHLYFADHTLMAATVGNGVTKDVSFSQWIEYIECARSSSVKPTLTAMNLIQKYYEKRRLSLNRCGCVFDFPHTLLQALISMSKSFARLSFCSDIEISHVIVAIMLIEENLLLRTGISPFSTVQISPIILSNILYESRQPDEVMNTLQQQVMDFISK